MSELSVALGAVVSDDFIHEAECSVGPHAFIGPSCIAGEGVRIEARATVMAPEPAPDGGNASEAPPEDAPAAEAPQHEAPGRWQHQPLGLSQIGRASCRERVSSPV